MEFSSKVLYHAVNKSIMSYSEFVVTSKNKIALIDSMLITTPIKLLQVTSGKALNNPLLDFLEQLC